MKKVFALLFVFLLCLQAIPVLHFFASEKSIFYTYVDEDKPDECKLKQKKESNDCDSSALPWVATDTTSRHYLNSVTAALPSPFLEFFAPPPNGPC